MPEQNESVVNISLLEPSLESEVKGVEDRELGKAPTFQLERLLSGGASVVFYSSLESIAPERIVRIQYTPNLLKTRGGSAHHVFGAIVSIRDQDGEEIEQPCVVKRHSALKAGTSQPKGECEFSNTCEVNQRGMRTVKPIALVRSETPVCFVLTKYDEDLVAGDTQEWKGLREDVGESVKEYLSAVASIIAKMHTAGVYHGDMQLKNIGLDKLTGEVFLYDWEASTIISRDGNSDRFELIKKDLLVFLKSCYNQKEFKSALLRAGEYYRLDDPVIALRQGTRIQYPGESKDKYLKRVSNLLKLLSLPELDEGVTGQFETTQQLKDYVYRTLGSQGLLGEQPTTDKRKKINELAKLGEKEVFWQVFQQLFLGEYFSRMVEFDPESATLQVPLMEVLEQKVKVGLAVRDMVNPQEDFQP